MGTWLETPVINQRDKRWAAQTLGKSTSTIGDYGCLVSAFSMLAGVLPPEMNSRMIAAGAYQTGDCPACAATFDIRRFTPSAPPVADYSLRYAYAPFPVNTATRLVAWLKAGKAAVLEVDLNPSNNTHDMHFVLGVSAFGHGLAANIVIHDPWFNDETTLTPRYGVTLARALVRAVYYGEGTP